MAGAGLGIWLGNAVRVHTSGQSANKGFNWDSKQQIYAWKHYYFTILTNTIMMSIMSTLSKTLSTTLSPIVNGGPKFHTSIPNHAETWVNSLAAQHNSRTFLIHVEMVWHTIRTALFIPDLVGFCVRVENQDPRLYSEWTKCHQKTFHFIFVEDKMVHFLHKIMNISIAQLKIINKF